MIVFYFTDSTVQNINDKERLDKTVKRHEYTDWKIGMIYIRDNRNQKQTY